MRIEITEINGKGLNLKNIDQSLDEFTEAAEKEYDESKERALKSFKARAFGLTGAIRNKMPEFMVHLHFIEDNRVILRNSLPFSKIAEKTGSYKKMEEGLKGYLKAKGFECDVKIMKDKEERDKMGVYERRVE
jgi:hypothetical protein